jgi:hypothetical protein
MRTLLLAAMATAALAAPLAAQTLGPAIPLYSSDSENGQGAVLAASPQGGFVAVWPRSDGALVVRGFEADGAPLNPAASRISPDDLYGDSHIFPSIAVLSTGGSPP